MTPAAPLSLFPADQTSPPKCRAHGCPGVASLCIHEADIAHGIRDPWARRPKSCLKAYDPKTEHIPY